MNSDKQGAFEENLGQHLHQNLVYLDLYFEDLKKSEIVENAADGQASLISDIGGQIGLWLGMSILTLLEMVYCCCFLIPRTSLRLLGLKITRMETTKKLKSFVKRCSKECGKTKNDQTNETYLSDDDDASCKESVVTNSKESVDSGIDDIKILDVKITNWFESKRLKAPIVTFEEDFEV